MVKNREQLSIVDDRAAKQTLDEGAKLALLELTRMGNHAVVQALLADLPMPVKLRHYLCGSVLVFRTSRQDRWADDTPQRAIMIAMYDRIERVLHELETGTVTPYATPAEIVTACTTISMEHPLPYPVNEVVEYCIYETARKHNWQFIIRTFEDRLSSIPLFGRIEQDYNHLAYRIRAKVIESGRQNYRNWQTEDVLDEIEHNEVETPDPYSVIAVPPQPSPEVKQFTELAQLSILDSFIDGGTNEHDRSLDRSVKRSKKQKSRKR